MKIHPLLFILCLAIPLQAGAQRNVLLIIADDLGTDYCGFYENHLDTAAMPNVRSLSGRGVRFINAWSNPICSPTRAGMLTGRYSFRTGVGDAVGPGSAVLDTAEITIPRVLNHFFPGQIAKANIGKWHLHNPMPLSNLAFPIQMGYDLYTGSFSGVLPDYYNWKKVVNGVNTTVTNYATTETTNDAIAWVKTQPNKPFFLWLAYNAPHTPLHLPPAGLHSYTNLSGTAADIAAQPKEYFKASLEALDHEIGRLFDSLAVLNRLDSTDIIFIGDNGDDPAVNQNQGSAKGSINQEGVSVPFIIAGPSVVNPGRMSTALVNTQDLFATILELFGCTDWKSLIPVAKPVDAKSIVPILTLTAADTRPWAFTEVFKTVPVAGDGKTMRNKVFKLLKYDNGNEAFYNLSNDPTENNNLLLGNWNGNQQANYEYLCNEMTNLVGMGNYCTPSVSTETPVANEVISAFPNPFEDHIFLKNAAIDADLELSNAIGQIIFSGKNIEKQDFSSLPKGLYFLKISGKTLVKLFK